MGARPKHPTLAWVPPTPLLPLESHWSVSPVSVTRKQQAPWRGALLGKGPRLPEGTPVDGGTSGAAEEAAARSPPMLVTQTPLHTTPLKIPHPAAEA